jgi:hypothetical protein
MSGYSYCLSKSVRNQSEHLLWQSLGPSTSQHMVSVRPRPLWIPSGSTTSDFERGNIHDSIMAHAALDFDHEFIRKMLDGPKIPGRCSEGLSSLQANSSPAVQCINVWATRSQNWNENGMSLLSLAGS